MRQTEAERLLSTILQAQMDIEAIRRNFQVKTLSELYDEDLRLSVNLLGRAADNLIPLAREMRRPVDLTFKQRIKRIFEHS